MNCHMNVIHEAKLPAPRVDCLVETNHEALSPASRVLALRPGLVLKVSAVRPGVQARFRFAIDNAPVLFGFIVSGANRCTYHDGRLKNTTRQLRQGQCGISYFPQTSGFIEPDPGAGAFVLTIMTTARLLDDYFRYAGKETSHAFADVMREKNDPFCWRAPTSPAKAALLTEILRNDHSGPARKLFLESRILELLALQFEECLGDRPRDHRECLRLTTADEERIRWARDLLVQDFDNPPSVSKLARMVGVNEKKLKAGFKQVFGQPVFEHFRDYRLERAREMLLTGEVRVSEAAYRIGYQSLSHFSRAFRERYGVNPKDYGRLRGES